MEGKWKIYFIIHFFPTQKIFYIIVIIYFIAMKQSIDKNAYGIFNYLISVKFIINFQKLIQIM